MYQILQHALADPTNKTKFTLLFGNVEERDILLRENFETLAKKHPETFKVVHVLGTAPENWKGAHCACALSEACTYCDSRGFITQGRAASSPLS